MLSKEGGILRICVMPVAWSLTGSCSAVQMQELASDPVYLLTVDKMARTTLKTEVTTWKRIVAEQGEIALYKERRDLGQMLRGNSSLRE